MSYVSYVRDVVAVVRRLAEANKVEAPLNATVDRDLLDVVLAAAERAEKAEEEAEAWHQEATNMTHVAFVDAGANSPVTWRDRAEEIEGLAMGQAYQIVGHLLACLDDESIPAPTEEEGVRLMNYLSAGKYDDTFLPWPRELRIDQ